MPPFKQVQSLYALCLEEVFVRLHLTVQKNSNYAESLRTYVQSHLHAGIREHLVQVATEHCRDNAYLLLDLLSIFMDRGIRKLSVILAMDQCTALYSNLEQYETTGLTDLIVKVVIDPRKANNLEYISSANITLHRVLRNGLASSLHTLVLHSACDNEVLRLLGQHCTNLHYLDVTSSWLVDDAGLKQLCLKDPEYCNLLSDVSSLKNCKIPYVNPCCEVLQEVRIQDTNTSELGVVLLLLLLPNLKSLGGFIYYRNVGDAIISMQQLHADTELSLTDLWDTSLPDEKAKKLALCLPNLSSIYTRGSWLDSLVQFPAISCITIDFDFVDFSQLLENYLSTRGHLLKKLVIVDQNHAVDVITLAELCPSLEELGAKLEATDEPFYDGHFFPCLVTARIRVGCTAPFVLLLGQALNLRHLEVHLEEERLGFPVESFDDAVMAEALSMPGTRALSTFLMCSDCLLSAASARALLAACPALQRIGELQFWTGMCERDVEELAMDVLHFNYYLNFRYRGKWYPLKRHCFCIALALQSKSA